jgi:hypothetical protein
MFANVGAGELVIIAIIGALSVVPVAAIVWVVRTLGGIRARQEMLLERLGDMERTLKTMVAGSPASRG